MSERAMSATALGLAVDDGTATPAMAYEWLTHRYVCTGDMERKAAGILWRAVQAPAVGVSPQPTIRHNNKCMSNGDSGEPCDCVPASLSPVEPTPEPPRDNCRRCGEPLDAHLCLDAPCRMFISQSVEPAPPTPAPCVWTERELDGWPIPGCLPSARTEDMYVRPSQEDWTHCAFCGHPLQITR